LYFGNLVNIQQWVQAVTARVHGVSSTAAGNID